jgi:signal transduction histidine kinase
VRRFERWRASLTVALLVVSLLTTALLALQAHATFLYHRVTAEQALRDFARLAASEFIRRATARLGYDGYAVLLAASGRRLDARGLPADLERELTEHADARVRAASSLARRYFAAVPRTGRLAFVPEPLPPEIAGWLIAKLKEREPATGFAVAHTVMAGEPRSFVFGPVHGQGDWEAIGFEVDLEHLGAWLRTTLEAGPLLPPFLGQGNVTNASLFVAFKDQGGVERLRSGATAWPLSVEVRIGNTYSGVLEGSRVQVAIEPSAARRLVIGGVPQSRVGLVLGLLGLSTGLVVVALLQLRRERALQRLREEFIANVSHELRTPLTQIRMFAETLLLDRVRSDQERRRALEIIDREARRLTHLVENVLQFSRGERGTLSIAPHACDVVAAVRDTIELFAPIAAGRAVRVTLDAAGPLEASVDEGAIHQIVLNLLDNAVRYGPEGQKVVVHVERDGRTVRIGVDDEGLGIPPRERRRVWSRYYRLGRESERAIAGAGIGLSVVRELVELHGGRARIEESPRGGARIVVEIPA